jgi:Integrase core domain
VHVSIDYASRVAFVQVMPDQRKQTAIAFLEAAIAYLAKLGVQVERVMTDNGSPTGQKRSVPANSRLTSDLH